MTDKPALTVAELVELCPLPLSWVAGTSGGTRQVALESSTSSGSVEVGYLNPIHPYPVQIVGLSEFSHLQQQSESALRSMLEYVFSPKYTAMIIITDGIQPSQSVIDAAQSSGTALLSSSASAAKLVAALQGVLSEHTAPSTLLHGVMMAVYGLGVLITGRSGIGKSELGLELLSRNHRLIADDAVQIRRTVKDQLIGSCPERLHGHLEVRGLGILNIVEMFGYTAVVAERSLDIIVHLHRLRPGDENQLDRLQINREKQAILGLEVPRVSLNIAPGRNLAVLVEAAVRDSILRMRGRNASAQFVDNQLRSIEGSK